MIPVPRTPTILVLCIAVQGLGTCAAPWLVAPASAEPAEHAQEAKAEGGKDEGGKDEGGKGEEEALDTEHLFGFAEGSGIGSKGEREIESISVGSFGKVGSYNQVDTETSFRYVVANTLRLSIGTLTDAYDIHDVPGLDNRTAFTFTGVIAEARLNLVDDKTHPYGVSLSFDPQYRQFDPVAGTRQSTTALPLTLLYDVALIPSKLLAAVNVAYTPAFFPAVAGVAGHSDDVAVFADLTYAATPKLFFGGELRHEILVQAGLPTAHALFLGPSAFYNLAPAFDVKVAWAIQVPDVGSRGLDVSTFERHQVEVQLVYGF